MQSRETSRKIQRHVSAFSAAVVEALECRTLLSAYTITDLGEFPASVDNGSLNAVPTGVTDNGTVVGYSTRNLGGKLGAFVWTASTGMTKLASVNATTPDDPSNDTFANAVSNGGIIVGESDGLPVVWGGAGSAASQLQLPDGATSANAEAIVGSYVAGQVFSPGNGDVAVEWDANGNPINRGPADNITSLANANGGIQSTGSILGTDGLDEATFNGAAIGFLQGGSLSIATGLNTSLQVVGFSTITGSPDVSQAFIYTTATGMLGLGFLHGETSSQAKAINDSGIVVGQAFTPGGPSQAFIWSQNTGMVDLVGSLLPAHSGWSLTSATAISPNGLIVGTGTNPQGQTAAFLLTPKSSTVAMAGVLFPAITKTTLPKAIVTGNAVHGAVTVALANQTAANQKGTATINIYASGDGSIDGTATLIASFKHNVNVHAGKSQLLNLAVKSFPSTLAAGTYTLLGEVVDSAGATDGSVGPAVTVAAPFVSISAALSALTAHALKSGVTVTLTNGGNIADSGLMTDSIGFSTDAAGQTAVGTPLAGAFLNKGAQLKPGKSVRKHVSGWSKLTSGLSAGQYYLTITISDGGGHTAEAVSATPVTVG